MKTQDDVAKIMQETFLRLDKLRGDGQKEYAHDNHNALRNFEALAGDLKISREQVLWVYVKKHLDGILSYINGYTSQRESVHGRIDDVHVYLELLRAMIIDNNEPKMSQQEIERYKNMQNQSNITPTLANQSMYPRNENPFNHPSSIGMGMPDNLK